jgi:hypothetical protein
MHSVVTDDTSLVANLGKHGGITVRAPDPTPEELEAAKARIRASWSDPLLRLQMALPPVTEEQARPRRGSA